MDLHKQEAELRDLLHRAKNSPDRTGQLRREALQSLIDLAHSNSTPLKIIAAEQIPQFLTDFPDLEEMALDAIYDICEDSFSKVRIAGYLAVTRVSRVQSRWVKRNVDVLVQLLQSEATDETIIVKKALAEHLELDPNVTLSVLCDQMTSPDETADEEETIIRERLRSLVLAFMAGEARQAICKLHALGAPKESVLYEGLFAAIPSLGESDLNLALNELIFALPAFTSQKPNERGSELLQLLLTKKAQPALKEDSRSTPIVLSRTIPILEICEHLTCTLQAAPALDLLQFFCSSLVGKLTLQKMQMRDQQWTVCSLARILSKAEKQLPSVQFVSLRRTITDACPYLLEVFKRSIVPQTELSATYRSFLEACNKRARESTWIPPSHLFKVFQEFRTRPDAVQNPDYEEMIMSLAPPSQASAPTTGQPQTTVAGAAAPTHLFPATRPSAPSASGSFPKLSSSFPGQTASAAYDRTKRELSTDVLVRPTKRTKVGGNRNVSKEPTLLSRLGTSMSRQSSLLVSSSRTQTTSPLPEEEPSPPPSQGISIKGAATKHTKQDSDLGSRVAPSSLLGRIQDSPGRIQDAGRKRRNV